MSRNRQVCAVSRGACCLTSFRFKTAQNVDKSKIYLRVKLRHFTQTVLPPPILNKALYLTEHWLDFWYHSHGLWWHGFSKPLQLPFIYILRKHYYDNVSLAEEGLKVIRLVVRSASFVAPRMFSMCVIYMTWRKEVIFPPILLVKIIQTLWWW